MLLFAISRHFGPKKAEIHQGQQKQKLKSAGVSKNSPSGIRTCVAQAEDRYPNHYTTRPSLELASDPVEKDFTYNIKNARENRQKKVSDA